MTDEDLDFSDIHAALGIMPTDAPKLPVQGEENWHRFDSRWPKNYFDPENAKGTPWQPGIWDKSWQSPTTGKQTGGLGLTHNILLRGLPHLAGDVVYPNMGSTFLPLDPGDPNLAYERYYNTMKLGGTQALRLLGSAPPLNVVPMPARRAIDRYLK